MSDTLEFWVAYQEAEGGKRNYLSNGRGKIRLFKSEQAIMNYLLENLMSMDVEKTIVHSVQGKIVVPEPELVEPAPLPTITTLYPVTAPPSAEELLTELKSRKRHKPKGRAV